jgi:hypothetical protein
VTRLRSILRTELPIGWLFTLWHLFSETYRAYSVLVRVFVYVGVALNLSLLLVLGLGQLAGFIKLSDPLLNQLSTLVTALTVGATVTVLVILTFASVIYSQSQASQNTDKNKYFAKLAADSLVKSAFIIISALTLLLTRQIVTPESFLSQPKGIVFDVFYVVAEGNPFFGFFAGIFAALELLIAVVYYERSQQLFKEQDTSKPDRIESAGTSSSISGYP